MDILGCHMRSRQQSTNLGYEPRHLIAVEWVHIAPVNVECHDCCTFLWTTFLLLWTLLSTLFRCTCGTVKFIYAFEAWLLLSANNFDSMVPECRAKGSVITKTKILSDIRQRCHIHFCVTKTIPITFMPLLLQFNTINF